MTMTPQVPQPRTGDRAGCHEERPTMTQTRLKRLVDGDWVFRALFWPTNHATGQHVIVRLLAMVVFVPWFFAMLFPLAPVLFVGMVLCIGQDVWRDMKRPTAARGGAFAVGPRPTAHRAGPRA